MSYRALVYAYVLGGLTFIPLVLIIILFIAAYTSVPAAEPNAAKSVKPTPEKTDVSSEQNEPAPVTVDFNDLPRARKGWLTVRRTFEESALEGSYVALVRSYLDSRSKDPKRSRPRDMWYVVLKGKVLYLYEDENMTECEAVVELGGHDVVIFPENLPDGELFTRRNAICLKPKALSLSKTTKGEVSSTSEKSEEKEMALKEDPVVSGVLAPWFIFVRTITDMEDWYLALVHASDHPTNSPTLAPLRPIFDPAEMSNLVTTLDAQPDVIPMRWLNALLGRLFFSYYRTQVLETFIIDRLMKKLSKVKRPTFLTDIVVTQVSVGNKAPTLSKPMLKELTKEGDTALEVHLHYKGEIRITVEATATINLGARFKSYEVKIVLAAVLKELDGNLLIKVKRPPSNRIWYAFTQTPKMTLEVEPIVSDRQITWTMILSTIEARLREIIQESVVMPNMDDLAFFESSQCEHRGGIWPDARRIGMALPLPQPSPSNSISTISSISQESSTLGVTSTTTLQTRSAEELHLEFESPPEYPPRAASVSGAEPYSGLPPESDIPRSSNIQSNDDNPKDTGTSFQEDADHELTAPTDSRSGVVSGDDSDDLPHESEYKPRSENEKRSPSQTSLAPEDPEMAPSDPGDFSSWNPMDFKLPASPAHKASRSSSNSALNASSFLSTLKARATDKEALSRSAKEAMRKWGVNWTGLRRNSTDRTDDMPDHGAAESRSRTESVAHRIRASYADVRAAVAERREKERDSHTDSSNSNGAQSTSRRASLHSSTDASSERSWHPSSAPEPNPLNDNLSKTLDSSLSTATQSQPRSRSSEGTKSLPEPPDFVPQTAIYTQQPSQARTMTIPGIHPSHRGEVMSMGYVAPSQPDKASKNPAIQSVYRLWKNSLQTSQPSDEVDVGRSSDAIGNFADDLGSSHEDHERSVARDAPPPLPPRPVPTPAPHALPESPDMEPSKSFMTEDEITSWSQGTSSPVDSSADMTDGTHAEAIDISVPFPPVLPPRNISVKPT